ncbi:MAG: hypothetical protein K8R53_08650 [Bacteroidales bacterium]|nr:hypothetical protein [Bacteroidales bacterium]
MSVLPTSGSVNPGDSLFIEATFSSGNNAAGNYNGIITVFSNDPFLPSFAITATLTVVAPLSATASADPVELCVGSSTQLNVIANGGYGNYTYSWTSNPPGFSSILQNPVTNPLVNSTYYVEVSDGTGVVSASVSVTVYDASAPPPVTNMLPPDNSYNITVPIQFSWAPSSNVSVYDLYIWSFDEPQPTTPYKANLLQINYTYNSGPFVYGDTCKWQVVAKNPCFETPGPIQDFSIKGLPELHVSGITNSTPQAGQEISVSWTVQNDGEGETPPGTVWYDRVWISPDIEVRIGETEDILLGQYPNVSYLDVGQSYVQNHQIQMPANLIGTYFLFVITDALDALAMNWPPEGPPLPYNPPPFYFAYSHGGSYVNVVHEISDDPPRYDNFFYKEITFDVPPLPDLEVTSMITPDNSFSGQPVDITWTVTNNGDGNTNTDTWSDRIYFSEDTVFNQATATNLGTFNHTGFLNPDSSYTQTQSVTVPENIFGTYYFYIQTDNTDQVFEHVYENNNISKSDSVVIILTPPPDFIVSEIFGPDTISNIGIFELEWTVFNQGASAPTVSTWHDGVFLTTDPNYNLTNAINLGTQSQSFNLQPGSSYFGSKSINLAQNITGPYYLYLATDVNDDVFEYLNEDNNLLRSDTTIIIVNPDLVVTNVIAPEIDTTGEVLSISWSVMNDGIGFINSQNWTDKIFLSSWPVYHPDSVMEVGSLNYTATLAQGNSVNNQKDVLLPDQLSGPYFFYIYTDWLNSVFEHNNENNNVTRSDTSINILKPDLMVSDITIPEVDSTGQEILISWKVSNLGPGTALERDWSDRIMLSFNSVYDPNSVVEIATLDYRGLITPGNSLIKQKAVQLPESVPGPYYIYIHTDYSETIFENYQEENNIARSINTIEILRADLIVSNMLIPSTVNFGESMLVEWVTKNQGAITIQNSSWIDRIMLSSYNSYHADSVVFLGELSQSGPLPAGGSLQNQLSVTIPNGFSGQYYTYVFTDFNDVIDENINENNNTGNASLQVTVGPWADLQVMNIELPDTANAGDNLPLEYVVKNNGNKTITGLSWSDKVYISDNPSWNVNDVEFLREFQQSYTLEPDSSYGEVSSVNLPVALTSGEYYIYIYTDESNNIIEYTDEGNNILRSNSFYINELPPVDLLVKNVGSPVSANSGETINTIWAVENAGQYITLESWYDAVYLSMDSLYDKNSDQLLGEWEHFGALNPGDTYETNQSYDLPNGIQGDYYLLVVTDRFEINNDLNLANNFNARVNGVNVKQITQITLTPPPDLLVSAFFAPSQATTGIPETISWTVENIGVGVTIPGNWTDNIYLSGDFTINQGDLLLGSKTRTVPLNVNESYNESIQVTFPNSVSGNYIVIIKTDFGNGVYEMDENNNTSDSFIILAQPPPADLFVTEIVPPDTAFVGETVNIQWTVKNIGQNQANGMLIDHVYFSLDPQWDINDMFFGSYQSNVNISPDEELVRNLTAGVGALTPGDYHVIVRTDILNNIFEDVEDNNSSASFGLINIDIQELLLGVITSDTLNNFEDLYFRIEIVDSLENATMLTTLKGDSVFGSNEMYMRYNEVSTRIDYDYSHGEPYAGNQEVIIPSVEEGNYYLLLYGNTLAGNEQNIDLLAEILEFEIRAVDPETGGNTGPVTIRADG